MSCRRHTPQRSSITCAGEGGGGGDTGGRRAWTGALVLSAAVHTQGRRASWQSRPAPLEDSTWEGRGGVESVSAGVSPVVLVDCVSTGIHNCRYGKLPCGQAWRTEVLPLRAGTFCLRTRGLSPGGKVWNAVFDPGFSAHWSLPRGHRGSPPHCALT